MIKGFRGQLLKINLSTQEISTESLNENYTKDFLGGTLQGAVSSLHGVNRDWKELEIKVSVH